MKKPHQTILFLIKTCVVAIFTYAFLTIASNKQPYDHLHDQFTFPQKPEIHEAQTTDNGQLETLIQEIDSSEHPVAQAGGDPIASLCKSYQTICSLTTFDSRTFSDKQKLYYQALIIHGLTKLEKMGIPVLSYLDNITIRSNSIKSRGYSSRNQVVLDVKAMNGYSEFLQVFIHELGHIIDFRYLEGDASSPKSSDFTEFGKRVFPVDDPSLEFYGYSRLNENTKTRYVTYKDFVSGYAGSDIYEDFAESVNFYQNYNSIFKELAKTSDILNLKFNFIDSIFGDQFINNGQKKSSQFSEFNWEFRPYDTTRF